MGFFNKNKGSPPGKSAAEIFAKKNDEKPAGSFDENTAARVAHGYGQGSQGSAGVQKQQAAQNTPVNAIEELKRIRAERKGQDLEKFTQTSAEMKADSDNRLAAGDAITARKNLISSAHISQDQLGKMSEGERAAIDAQGMATLANIVSGIKNEQFLTEVDEEISETIVGRKKKDDHVVAGENLSSDEALSRTAAIRNLGFFTETDGSDNKPISAAKKLEQDLDELESAEQAIASFTNSGFRHQNAEHGVMSEDITSEDELKEEGE